MIISRIFHLIFLNHCGPGITKLKSKTIGGMDIVALRSDGLLKKKKAVCVG
jgi:hypothetical protein